MVSYDSFNFFYLTINKVEHLFTWVIVILILFLWIVPSYLYLFFYRVVGLFFLVLETLYISGIFTLYLAYKCNIFPSLIFAYLLCLWYYFAIGKFFIFRKSNLLIFSLIISGFKSYLGMFFPLESYGEIYSSFLFGILWFNFCN